MSSSISRVRTVVCPGVLRIGSESPAAMKAVGLIGRRGQPPPAPPPERTAGAGGAGSLGCARATAPPQQQTAATATIRNILAGIAISKLDSRMRA